MTVLVLPFCLFFHVIPLIQKYYNERSINNAN
nr:MAG TPA: hypothetical protein [Caudoviricetes sp.]